MQGNGRERVRLVLRELSIRVRHEQGPSLSLLQEVVDQTTLSLLLLLRTAGLSKELAFHTIELKVIPALIVTQSLQFSTSGRLTPLPSMLFLEIAPLDSPLTVRKQLHVQFPPSVS